MFLILTRLVFSTNNALVNIIFNIFFLKSNIGKGYITGLEKNVRGNKQPKNRLTILFGCSMTGEKLPPSVIGKYQKPRCFKGITEFPVQYESNKKAWMTSVLFIQYLNHLDNLMVQRKKKIILFLDNCPSHPMITLNNIQLCFFPKCATSILQPLDQGIIESFKVIYKKALSQRQVNQLDAGILKPKSVDVLEAMHLIADSWNMVKITTITNCFTKSFFKIVEYMECQQIINENDIIDKEILSSIESEKIIICKAQVALLKTKLFKYYLGCL